MFGIVPFPKKHQSRSSFGVFVREDILIPISCCFILLHKGHQAPIRHTLCRRSLYILAWQAWLWIPPWASATISIVKVETEPKISPPTYYLLNDRCQLVWTCLQAQGQGLLDCVKWNSSTISFKGPSIQSSHIWRCRLIVSPIRTLNSYLMNA